MKEVMEKIRELQKKLSELESYLNIVQQRQKVLELQDQMSQPGFWAKQAQARQVSQELNQLTELVEKFESLEQEISDIESLVKEAAKEKDNSLEKDLDRQLAQLQKRLENLELVTYLSGKYDNHAAIIAVHAGAGGVDAQDWAEMLLGMYIKLAERRRWPAELIHISRGDEAGLKSAILGIKGLQVYGYLKNETGVHRLVRLSPFDADHARHTSFAYVEILPELDLPEVSLNETEIKVDTFRSSGPGGQSVNTTDSAVRLTHEPTGITVSVQSERSQHQNKEQAMKILAARVKQYEEAEVEEERQRLRGELTEAAWGHQIRSYVLHPYKLVKDHRTDYEETNPEAVLAGELDSFLETSLKLIQK